MSFFTSNKRSNIRSWVYWALLLAPILVFYRIVFGHQTISGDYLSGYVQDPVLYRYFTELGFDPMWEPARSGGIPFSGNPSTQAFHFPRWLLTHFPGFLEGYALDLLLLKHFVLLIFGQSASYFVLRRLTGWGRLVCYLVSFASVYNLSTLDSFRYGISLDALTYGQVLILTLLYFLETAELGALVAIALLAQLFFTSSYYPTIPFLGFIGGGCALLFLAYRGLSLGESTVRLAQAAFAGTCGVLMAAPNWLHLTELVEWNSRRVHASTLDWANFQPLEKKIGPFINFTRPWGAEVHSGFGSTSVLPLGLGALGLGVARKLQYWPLLLWLVFPFVYAMGAQTPVLEFFFNHVPGFSSIRVPGRILGFMPVIFISVLVIAKSSRVDLKSARTAMKASALLNALALLISLWFLFRYPSNGWRGVVVFPDSPEIFYPSYWTQSLKLVWIALGFGACAAFFLATRLAALLPVLVAISVLQALIVVSHGTWMESRIPSPTRKELNARDYLPAYPRGQDTQNSGGADSVDGFAVIPFVAFAKAAAPVMNCYYPFNEDQREIGVALPYYLSNNIFCRKGEQDVFQSLRLEKSCTASTVIHTYLTSPDCDLGLDPATTNLNLRELNQRNELLSLTHNVLKLKVATKTDSVLVTRFPLITSNWSALIDDREAPIIKVNGVFVGVKVPAGAHIVSVRYLSGRVLFAYNLVFAGFFALFAGIVLLKRKAFRAPMAVALLFGAAVVLSLGARFVQKRAIRDALADASLPNSYQTLLVKQLERWGITQKF